MRAIVNGKLVDLPEGSTVADLRSKFPEVGNDDVMEQAEGGTRPMNENEALKQDFKYYAIPKIIKG